jgi:hypothetical protein
VVDREYDDSRRDLDGLSHLLLSITATGAVPNLPVENLRILLPMSVQGMKWQAGGVPI